MVIIGTGNWCMWPRFEKDIVGLDGYVAWNGREVPRRGKKQNKHEMAEH